MERKYWCHQEIQGLVATGQIEHIQKAYLRCYDTQLSNDSLLLALGLQKNYTHFWISILYAVQLYWGSCVSVTCDVCDERYFIRRKTNTQRICSCIRDRATDVKQLLKTSHRRRRKYLSRKKDRS